MQSAFADETAHPDALTVDACLERRFRQSDVAVGPQRGMAESMETLPSFRTPTRFSSTLPLRKTPWRYQQQRYDTGSEQQRSPCCAAHVHCVDVSLIVDLAHGRFNRAWLAGHQPFTRRVRIQCALKAYATALGSTSAAARAIAFSPYVAECTEQER